MSNHSKECAMMDEAQRIDDEDTARLRSIMDELGGMAERIGARLVSVTGYPGMGGNCEAHFGYRETEDTGPSITEHNGIRIVVWGPDKR
jgi:hypothetical protein